jgi:hypothetical protein
MLPSPRDQTCHREIDFGMNCFLNEGRDALQTALPRLATRLFSPAEQFDWSRNSFEPFNHDQHCDDVIIPNYAPEMIALNWVINNHLPKMRPRLYSTTNTSANSVAPASSDVSIRTILMQAQ